MDVRRFEQTPLDLPSLNPDLRTLDLNAFPLIEDFEARLDDAGPLGGHVTFCSPSRGVLASFEWWDDAESDLQRMDPKDIPCGSLDDPHADGEQSWQIYIFEREGLVYVLEGGDPGEPIDTWFKVEKARYFDAWKRLIEECRRDAEYVRNLDHAFNAPHLVRRLVVKDRGLDRIPDEIETLVNLDTLDLSENNLATLPAGVARLQALTSVKLGSNRLKDLPECLLELPRLEYLAVDRNQLRRLPSSIGRLERLKFLSVAENRLTELPEELFRLPELAVLEASRNRIAKLPDLLFAPPKINLIELKRNELDPADCRRLRELLLDRVAAREVQLVLDF